MVPDNVDNEDPIAEIGLEYTKHTSTGENARDTAEQGPLWRRQAHAQNDKGISIVHFWLLK